MAKDTAWVSYEYYPDGVTVELVVSAAKKLGTGADEVLNIFGNYFVKYLKVRVPSSYRGTSLIRNSAPPYDPTAGIFRALWWS